jgi:hypothetical protein
MEVRMRQAVLLFMCLAVPAGAATAQSVIQPPPFAKTVNLSGPRFGLTALSTGVVEELHTRSIDVGPNISQFGWQFEKQFYSRDSGVAAVNEWVVLLGGLDQGVALPSLSWLVGLRTREGAEFGIGPNITPAGVALALAAGVTFRAGSLNVPMNVAVVPSKVGTRISVLTGFNMRRR